MMWHPRDRRGREIADAVLEHFHGTAYSGLVGGAVEVYLRSAAWDDDAEGPPRPLPYMSPLPNGLQAPVVTAVVPLLGRELMRAVESDERWRSYVADMVGKATPADGVGVFPVRLVDGVTDNTILGDLMKTPQALPKESAVDTAMLCRQLAQSIAQLIEDPLGDRLQVFVSHTKRHAKGELADDVTGLIGLVRSTIAGTHLRHFFDEADIQPGTDWEDRLDSEAERSALLVLRTDLYATREWCQREILKAKRAEMPVVTIYALHQGEERGSFLMDNVPTVQLVGESEGARKVAIVSALNILVDEALKRALWRKQRRHLRGLGFDWLPSHAPEPITVTPWILEQKASVESDDHVFVLHPDPPLGKMEMSAIADLFSLAGMNGKVDILTPRTFASRGGQVQK